MGSHPVRYQSFRFGKPGTQMCAAGLSPVARRRLHVIVHLKGWEMVYRYRVGVAEAVETRETTTAAPRRAA